MDVRCRFIKLHVSVDVRTKKIYTMTITDDKCIVPATAIRSP